MKLRRFSGKLHVEEERVWFPFAGSITCKEDDSIWHVLVRSGRVAIATNPHQTHAAFIYLEDRNLDVFRVDQPFDHWCGFDKPNDESEARVFCDLASHLLDRALDWDSVWPAISVAVNVSTALHLNFKSLMPLCAESRLFESS